MMLIYRTIPATPAGICQVPSNTSLKKRLATFARELTVVLSGAFVPANDTLNVLILVGTISTVLRVLRGCLTIDERYVRVVKRDGIDVSG